MRQLQTVISELEEPQVNEFISSPKIRAIDVSLEIHQYTGP
jgi:hypothetical protein